MSRNESQRPDVRETDHPEPCSPATGPASAKITPDPLQGAGSAGDEKKSGSNFALWMVGGLLGLSALSAVDSVSLMSDPTISAWGAMDLVISIAAFIVLGVITLVVFSSGSAKKGDPGDRQNPG